MNLIIENLTKAHWEDVARIYQDGIHTGDATFESHAPEWTDWDQSHLNDARIVAISNKVIVGWAALSGVSSRCIYSGVAEVSVYVDQRFQGNGFGKRLLDELIIESEKAGLWMLNASVFPENESSIALLKKCGFREIGYKEKVGKMAYGMHKDQWRNNILLERRSKIVGV